MPALALGVNEAAIHAKPATFHKAADDPMGAAFRNLTARRVKAAQAIRSPYWDAAFRFGAAKSDRALVRLDTLPSLLTVRTFSERETSLAKARYLHVNGRRPDRNRPSRPDGP